MKNLFPFSIADRKKKRGSPPKTAFNTSSFLRFAIAGLAFFPLLKAKESCAGYHVNIKDQPDWMKIPLKWLEPKKPVPSHAWTGSLLSPSPAFPGGVYGLEPYTTATVPTGTYDSKGNLHQHGPGQSQFDSISSGWFLKGSPTDHISLDITPTFTYAWTPQSGPGAPQNSHVKFADLPFDIEYRFTDTYSPSISVVFGASAPTGDYNHLERASDGVGAGVWKLRYGFNGQFVEPFFKQAVRIRWWAVARTPLGNADLRDITSYGTETGFRGEAHPGSTGEEGLAFEFGITKRWLFALDLYNDWGARTGIKGCSTTATDSTNCQYGSDTIYSKGNISSAWGAAPAIEYAPNGNFGLIAGVQLNAFGTNTSRTLAPQMAVFYAW
ncbi:hypothetical protein FAI41_03325 [Acetobacteraceae bacterium]|nr:hypothetical protein FAI41_03325 [Acetobacteraceae bacterium]